MTSPLTQLDQLKQFTTVVADTGNVAEIAAFAPRDATTNPSLILKAVEQAEYRPILDRAIRDHRTGGNQAATVERIMDAVLIGFGEEILRHIPGRVSTETDARLSFDQQGIVDKSRHLISLYEQAGIPRERILIKIASTWEGIQAGRVLEAEGIHCNLTLLFSLPQAVACAEGEITLISPFVGRILDWFKAKHGRDYTGAEDPGVQSVHEIYSYYKRHGHATEVMGASFRNIGEILELAGCDLLTIAPKLLAELQASTAPVPRKLDPVAARTADVAARSYDERRFRWELNENAMATEKLAEGIRVFAEDARKLEAIISAQLGA